jgi:hypothetical protein
MKKEEAKDTFNFDAKAQKMSIRDKVNQELGYDSDLIKDSQDAEELRSLP